MISIKFQSNFIEITLQHGCSPVNLLHIFRAPFRKNTAGGLLLTEFRQHVFSIKTVLSASTTIIIKRYIFTNNLHLDDFLILIETCGVHNSSCHNLSSIHSRCLNAETHEFISTAWVYEDILIFSQLSWSYSWRWSFFSYIAFFYFSQ